MCFEINTPHNTWTSRPDEKDRRKQGHRRVSVGKGAYVIQHEGTGKFITGVSNNVSIDVDREVARLVSGQHSCKHMVRLIHLAHEITMYEIPTKNATEAKKILSEIRAKCYPPYCNLDK